MCIQELPFLLSDFFKGKIIACDLGSNDIDLPLIDARFDGSSSEGSNSQNEEEGEEDSESLVKCMIRMMTMWVRTLHQLLPSLLPFLEMIMKVRVGNNPWFVGREVRIPLLLRR